MDVVRVRRSSVRVRDVHGQGRKDAAARLAGTRGGARPVASIVCAVAAVACGSSPEAKSTGVTECSAQATPASDKVRAVIDANLACNVDDDCMTLAVSSACFDQCTTAIAKSGRAAVGKALSDVSANECKAFADAGCKVIIPPCAPPSPPVCREGKCS